jgi:hypothetical protein
MNDNYIFLLLIDIKNNILLLNLNQYTGFLSTKIIDEDKLQNNNIPSQKKALLRLIKEKFKLLTSDQRLDDITLYDITGNILPVYIHRINDEEKNLILNNNLIDANFTNINNLPSNLDILSSSISQAITTYPKLLSSTTFPPSNQKIIYPSEIQKYSPAMEVPLLMPLDVYQKQKQNILLPTQVKNQLNKQPIFEPIQKKVTKEISHIVDITDDELVDDNEKYKIKTKIIEPPKFNPSIQLNTDLEINKKKYLEMEKKYLKYKEKYLEAKKEILNNAVELTDAKLKIIELEKKTRY